MTYTEFKKYSEGKTEKEAVISLIKAKHPAVVKLNGKGRYALVDDDGNQFLRTKGLKVR